MEQTARQFSLWDKPSLHPQSQLLRSRSGKKDAGLGCRGGGVAKALAPLPTRMAP